MAKIKRMGAVGREVRVAVIGVGGRGHGQMCTLLGMPDVKVAVVCDIYQDRIDRSCDECEKQQGFRPDGTTDYTEAIGRDDIEAVFVFSSWQTHIRIACDAMRMGKYVAMEVGGASSVGECWKLVRTSEDTGMPCMMLENCCYDQREMAALNMVKKGLFGELVHAEGGYLHDLRDEIGLGDVNRHYRQDNFHHRNGELYPTHELGPISKCLNINRGNRMLSLTSIASKAAGLRSWYAEKRPDTAFPSSQINEGDIVTTMIKCANGETICLKHDCSLPRPYSRGFLIQGTKGIWQEDGARCYFDGMSPIHEGEWTHSWESEKDYIEKYRHPLWEEYERFGLRGGHGGMDYLVLRAFIEAVQERKGTPIDVYDTASWMVVTALSESSVAMGGLPVAIPDFTDGLWINRPDHDDSMFTLETIPERLKSAVKAKARTKARARK